MTGNFSDTANHSATPYKLPLPHATAAKALYSPPAPRATTANGKAIDTARFLIHLAASEEEPEFLTHLRLQKLLYLAQGWSLAMRSKSLFDDTIEAWAHGPVVPSVYREFRVYGEKPIDPSSIPQATTLSKDEQEFVAALWNGYKKYSAGSLRQMTHEQEPWIAAREGYRPGEQCTKEITKAAMKAFFKKMLKA